MGGRRIAGMLVAFGCAAVLAGCSAAGDRVEPVAQPPSAGTGSVGSAVAPGPVLSIDDPGVCPQSRPSGWVAAENARPGTPARVGPDDAGAVLGYLDRTSASCGDRVWLQLGDGQQSRPRTVTVAAYRIGWYGGAGARLVWRSAPVIVSGRAVPPELAQQAGTTVPQHLVLPDWPPSLELAIGPGWVPGMYLLVPQQGETPVGPAIPLVVRDPAGAEPIELVASTLTWNAYNDWGGWSLYRGPVSPGRGPSAAAGRARVVAVHRPLTGAGYDQLTFMDLPVVHQLERVAVERHLDVRYTTDLAVDADPRQLADPVEVVFGGHSEYWTTRMYDGLLAAQAGGVNAVFLGANNLWWRARLEGTTAAREPEREVVYRVAGQDPDVAEPTIQWQSATPPRDPATVLGQSHAGIGVHGGLQLVSPPAWFLAGSGLTAGQALDGAVGNEADGYNPKAHNPARTQVFADGLLEGAHGPVLTTVSYSTSVSGAAVFAAGTTDWACASSGTCEDRTVPPATARAVAVLTRNVLATLATPQIGLADPPDGTGLSTFSEALRLRPREAIGSYGGASTDESSPRIRH